MSGHRWQLQTHVLWITVFPTACVGARQVKYRDSGTHYVGPKEASYCMLRSQLLMALHDEGSEVRLKVRPQGGPRGGCWGAYDAV
jgi:hypothetical protein